MVKRFTFEPIGFVKSNFEKPQDTKTGKIDSNAKIEVLKKHQDGLVGIDGFSHIIVVFCFHLSEGYKLFVHPLKYNPENKIVGVFATHSPFRPNPIGVSVVRLKKLQDNILTIENKDILNNSPVLDIKPYLPEDIDNLKLGWYVPKKGGNI
jgi:tRNA-Thr(GGU) m(6)t(6)A37 methyltransferase TsaA